MKDRGKCAGVTLVESMIAIALVTMLAGGLYATGVLVRKLALHNELSGEAKGYAILDLEEVSALEMNGIVSGVSDVPYSCRTKTGNSIIVTRTILGHDADWTTRSNLTGSAFLEVHSAASFISPLTRKACTCYASTIVR